MTHIDNIPHILQYGVTHASSPNTNQNYIPIGDRSLINNRNAFILPNGNKLGQYIPFYFWGRMPMLYVIQNGYNGVPVTQASSIVYYYTNVEQVINFKLDFVFTNGHAVDCFTEFFYPKNIQDIETIVDFKAVNCKYWKNESDLDLKRRKEAEFLVLDDIPTGANIGYIVFDEKARNKLLEWGVNNNKVYIRSNYYF